MYFAVTQSCCCEEDTETLYSCTPSGCVEDINGTLTQRECASTCKSWECQEFGCIQVEGNGGYAIQSICQDECKSFECILDGCIERNGSGGTYLTLADCQADSDCRHWECESGGCTSALGLGEYTTEQECEQNCTSYTCSGNTCQLISGPGGEFLSLQDCVDSGCQNTSWECTDSGCVPIGGTSGYLTQKECNAECCKTIICWGCASSVGTCFSQQITSCNNQDCEALGRFSFKSACDDVCVQDNNSGGGSDSGGGGPTTP